MPAQYCKVKPKGQRPFWAIKRQNGKLALYTRVSQEGTRGDTLRVFVAAPGDVEWEAAAVMNRRYAQLEVVEEK